MATAKKEEVAAEVVEKTLEAIDETVETLERIPKVHLNGTTKAQQVAILTVTFVAGAVVGGFVAYKVTEKKLRLKYERIAEEDVAAARKFYKEGPEYSDPVKLAEQLGAEVASEPDPLFEEAVEAVRSYGGGEINEVRVTETHVEVEVETPEEVADRNIFVDHREPEDLFDLAKDTANRDPLVPFIIYHDEFMQNDPEHEQVSLTYYEGDQTLSDERDEPVPDPEATVGLANLERFGHGSKDANLVYIRNETLNMDFSIARSPGKYAHEVLGFLEHSDRRDARKRAPRRFRDGDDG